MEDPVLFLITRNGKTMSKEGQHEGEADKVFLSKRKKGKR